MRNHEHPPPGSPRESGPLLNNVTCLCTHQVPEGTPGHPGGVARRPEGGARAQDGGKLHHRRGIRRLRTVWVSGSGAGGGATSACGFCGWARQGPGVFSLGMHYLSEPTAVRNEVALCCWISPFEGGRFLAVELRVGLK